MRRDELEEYDPFDEGVFCRSRFWLFISYVVSFASVVGAVWVLLGHYALNPDVTTVWPGIAGLLQVRQHARAWKATAFTHQDSQHLITIVIMQHICLGLSSGGSQVL